MKLIIAYKNFAANRNISHIGLGVSALNIAKTLTAQGIAVDVWPILSAADLRSRLKTNADVTHVVISAPWIPTIDLAGLINDFSAITFAVNCHSNVGFLQADTNGCKLLRENLSLQHGHWRFKAAGNSRKFCRWVEDAYNAPCAWLPNLYWLDHTVRPARPPWRSGTIRIGCFGATRPLKNLISSVGAAIEVSSSLRADVEIWISGGRTEGGGNSIVEAAKQLTDGIPSVKLVINPWQEWPAFVRTVGNMNILFQPSYTESFNVVTADGVSQGVPSVVSQAIDWAPASWQVGGDDVFEIARTARQLLHDPHAASEGLTALQAHNRIGVRAWRAFLAGKTPRI